MMSVTCYRLLAICYSLYDTCYLKLASSCKNLIPFAPVVRLALVTFCPPPLTLYYPAKYHTNSALIKISSVRHFSMTKKFVYQTFIFTKFIDQYIFNPKFVTNLFDPQFFLPKNVFDPKLC